MSNPTTLPSSSQSAAPQTAPATSASRPVPGTIKPPARATELGSTFVDWPMLPERATPNGIFRAVFDSAAPTLERLEMHVSTLNPGRTPHAAHCHPWEEIIILMEGSLEVSINDTKSLATAGAVIFFASNDAHTVVNPGDQPATYYVINFYTEAARAVPPLPVGEWAAPDKLRSGVINWDQGTLKEGTHDHRRIFINSATATFTSLKVHATTAAPHRYPVRHSAHLNLLLLIVKEGVVESTVNNVTHLVGPGSLIFLAPGAIQTIRNRGDVPVTYYVLAVSSEETPRAA